MRVGPGPFQDEKIVEGQFDGNGTFQCKGYRRETAVMQNSGLKES
jgi:hypothetical protein